jgi:hypothetical protein
MDKLLITPVKSIIQILTKYNLILVLEMYSKLQVQQALGVFKRGRAQLCMKSHVVCVRQVQILNLI